jgi:NADH-quinone oxidoreductase subunit C
MSTSDLALLTERFEYLTERNSSDHVAVNCPADKLIELCTVLRDELGYDLLLDVTAIDWDAASPRFTGIYHFLSTTKHEYLRIAADCTDDIHPSLPTLCDLYAAANWHERETYDLMGIRYEGHPNMTRILMWDSYPYHPLRKDFPLAGIEVPLPADDVAEITGASVLPAPMMGGPFVSSADGPMSQTEPRARDESWNEKKVKPTPCSKDSGK